MGVNVNAYLPAGVRISEVAKVIGILLGSQKEWEPGRRWLNVAGIRQLPTSVPELAEIRIDLTDANNPTAKAIRESDGNIYSMDYFFESNHGGPQLYPKCTAAKIALCKAVVIFFGGSVDYNDSDRVEVNLRAETRLPVNHSDDAAFADFQEALWRLPALTPADIQAVAEWAAY
jgi:hypothetical protein